MKTSLTEAGNVSVLAVMGKVATGPDTSALDTRLFAFLARGAQHAIVDLTDCERIDLTGVSVLTQHHERFARAGGELRLVLPEDGKIKEIAVISKLTGVFSVFETPADAAEARRDSTRA